MFVDLVNTVSRDNVRSQSNQIKSNPVDGRYNFFHFDDVDNEEVLQRSSKAQTAVV